jgi:type I restriction enzyme S subunit
MKEGWTNCKIGDICSITDFVSNGSFASLRENVKYYNEPNYAVLVRLADASNGFDKSKFVYTDKRGYDFSKKSHLQGGELIMSNVGSVGSMFICPAMTQPMTLAPNTISITSQNNKFLFYYFLSEGFKSKLKGITSSTTLKKFNKTNFKLLEITIPPLSEQQSIVDYLDSAFAKIDAMKANAEKALNEAQALFQASLKEMLEPKEGWEEKKLSDIGELKNGMNFNKNESGYNVHILGVGDFGNLFQIKDTDSLQTISLNSKPSEEYILKNEDIVFVRSNGNKNLVGRCVLIYVGNEHCSFSGFCIRLRKTTNEIDACYLTHFLKTEDARKKLVGNGANISNLNQKVLNEFVVSYPPLTEQQSIVATLDSLKSKVDQLQENYDKISQECDALKQAILRQVFE